MQVYSDARVIKHRFSTTQEKNNDVKSFFGRKRNRTMVYNDARVMKHRFRFMKAKYIIKSFFNFLR